MLYVKYKKGIFALVAHDLVAIASALMNCDTMVIN